MLTIRVDSVYKKTPITVQKLHKINNGFFIAQVKLFQQFGC